MKLVEMLDEKLITFHLDTNDKNDAIVKVGTMMFEAGKVLNKDKYIEGVFEREKEFSTGIGNGIAIPHCQSDCVKEVAFTFVKLSHSIEWGSLDDKPVNFIIMLAAPNTADNIHLKVLSTLAKNLMDDDFRSGL
ncbi:MAG: PTS sugar transporter subunit IIA, partial [Traorella sp.]